MTDITFDKLSYVDKLKSGGFTEKQARVHADALDTALRDSVATKSDITVLKSDIAKLKTELKTEIAAVETRILKWLVPLLLGQAALVTALVKLI